MMLTPGPVPLRHMSTPAKVVDMLRALCALDVPDALLKVPERGSMGLACSSGNLIRSQARSPRFLCDLTGLGGMQAAEQGTGASA